MKRTPSEIYDYLRQAGFAPASAAMMTAISLAESQGNDTAVGDVNLQTATWGPSYGLFQIRTLKADTGKGGLRDINSLSSGPLAQAQAAYQISRGGSDFTPWSTYTDGAYQKYLGAVPGQSGIGSGTSSGATTSPASLSLPSFPNLGSILNRNLALEIGAVALGLTIVAVGLAKTFERQLKGAAKIGAVAATL